VDVLLGESLPTPSEVAGRAVVVIDVLRASTTIVQALANGARAVVPFADVDEVVSAASHHVRADVCLAGERRAHPIAGFDTGNSPSGMTEARVRGRIVLMTTTNGTQALLATHGARAVFVGAFVNLGAVVRAVQAEMDRGSDVLIVCAGQDRRFALEDAACAGLVLSDLLRGRRGVYTSDAVALARSLGRRYQKDPSRLAKDAAHAHTLTQAGFGDDVAECLVRDRLDLIATYSDRQVTRERLVSSS
jgi:2-phosphosulfolactate phosphatase